MLTICYEALRKLQWRRGLRAGVAVSVAMIVCHMLGQPMGWAALGGFEVILVDNGGPYRSRLTTMGTLLVAGAVACVVGAVAATPLGLAFVVTAAFCFAITYVRVISQELASTSVIVLVLYFAGYGGSTHSLSGAAEGALQFVLGGAWAAALSLVLWPVDPFRPARLAVAECYAVLAEFATGVQVAVPAGDARAAARMRSHEFQRTMRNTIEPARRALETTAARATSRTVRARNLTVLLETADMLFAETIRWAELAEAVEDVATQAALRNALDWLGRAEQAVRNGLQQRPQDGGSSFAPEGSHSLEHVRGRSETIARYAHNGAPGLRHLAVDERDALQNIEIAFECVRAVWTGVEIRAGRAAKRWAGYANRDSAVAMEPDWMDALIANWSHQSVMMRHALRIAAVGGVDVVLMRTVHVSHGSWLAMTSIIVLQPFGSGTLRRSVQRVGGTIAGGVLAAVLAAAIHSHAGITAAITVLSVLTLATYAINYAWYSFFLTPTFVLMSLPHLRDWHVAGVRMGMTAVGALVAIAAMHLLWPEREQMHLERLLARGAEADAAYVRAMVSFWSLPETQRRAADRQLMAPVRRSCGLAINDAEETLDRLMLEPTFGRRSASGPEEIDVNAQALTLVTYLRRLAGSVTTLQAVGVANEATIAWAESVAIRLEKLSVTLLDRRVILPEAMSGTVQVEGAASLSDQQMSRVDRQLKVMERAAAGLAQVDNSSRGTSRLAL